MIHSSGNRIVLWLRLVLVGLTALSFACLAQEIRPAQSSVSINAKINYKATGIDDNRDFGILWEDGSATSNGPKSFVVMASSRGEAETNRTTDGRNGFETPEKPVSAKVDASKGVLAHSFLTPELESGGGFMGLKIQTDSLSSSQSQSESSSEAQSTWEQAFVVKPKTKVRFGVDARAALVVKSQPNNSRSSANADMEFDVVFVSGRESISILAPAPDKHAMAGISESDAGDDGIASKLKSVRLLGSITNESRIPIHGKVRMHIYGKTSTSPAVN